MAIFDNTKSSTVVSGTTNADTITNSGTNVTIDSGKGNDSVVSSGEKSSINGGDDRDFIENAILGTGSTLEGGNNDDTISISTLQNQFHSSETVFKPLKSFSKLRINFQR